MRLVDGVRIVVAEFVDDLGYPVVVLCGECISNKALELECAAFAFVIELIVERFGDIGVHIDRLRRLPLHVAAMDSFLDEERLAEVRDGCGSRRCCRSRRTHASTNGPGAGTSSPQGSPPTES